MKVIDDHAKLSAHPVVSILCITFNQVDYIRDAIDSFLEQDFDEDIEILINDDCSTDGTLDILLEYQRTHPDLFRIVTHEENQFSKGVRPYGRIPGSTRSR